MQSVVAAGAGFLLAVLWFDLMFDVQVRGRTEEELPVAVLASIAGYYARVTTAARPMNRLIAATMLITLLALGAELARGDLPAWRAALSLALALLAIGLAVLRTVRNAVRLGAQVDDIGDQSRLARLIWRDHVVCVVTISAVLLLQLAPA
jgi:hypothetical protein